MSKTVSIEVTNEVYGDLHLVLTTSGIGSHYAHSLLNRASSGDEEAIRILSDAIMKVCARQAV